MSLGLTLRQIRKAYGGPPVLQGCEFAFDRQGIYALMGGNGSGKSTLLRICALLEEPDSGTVVYSNGDDPVPHDITLRRMITLVLPGGVSFNASVFRNVSYGLRLRGVQRDDIEQKTSEALDYVRLGHKRGQNALTLSSGEAQRMGIARALAIEPRILLLDEPTASVDETNTGIIEEIIVGLRKRGITVIMTTHDPAQARRLADTLLVLKDGLLHEG